MCHHPIHSLSWVAEKSKESYRDFEQWKWCYWYSTWNKAEMLILLEKTALERFKLFLSLVFYPNPGFHECIINICQINFYMSSTGISITQIEVIAFRSTICLPQRLFFLSLSLGNIRKGSPSLWNLFGGCQWEWREVWCRSFYSRFQEFPENHFSWVSLLCLVPNWQ